MKSSRFSQEQIIGILKQGQAGVKVTDLCRQYGISDHTYYRGKCKFGGMEVSEAKRLKFLEEENRQLKQLQAEIELATTASTALRSVAAGTNNSA